MASYKQGRVLTGRKGFKAIQAVSAFTLVEMLVVVGILGFIGLASFDMASMGVRVKRALIDQEKVMFDSIRLWQWIERDMAQLVDRTKR
jgi:general secretion pathway protein J